MTNKNDPVYPIGNDPIASEGLSKREYFAALAMQGFLSNPGIDKTEYNEKNVAKAAVAMADYIIQKLNENQ